MADEPPDGLRLGLHRLGLPGVGRDQVVDQAFQFAGVADLGQAPGLDDVWTQKFDRIVATTPSTFAL